MTGATARYAGQEHHGGGFTATDTPELVRRARYGAAPPASRVATRSPTRRPAAALDPGDLCGPSRAESAGRPGLPAGARGAPAKRGSKIQKAQDHLLI
jgi:hypothetical protein